MEHPELKHKGGSKKNILLIVLLILIPFLLVFMGLGVALFVMLSGDNPNSGSLIHKPDFPNYKKIPFNIKKDDLKVNPELFEYGKDDPKDLPMVN
ncbi:UNVERIFIED_CONTAM: hypothetical protein O8I53_12120 [Campylobacter lari]